MEEGLEGTWALESLLTGELLLGDYCSWEFLLSVCLVSRGTDSFCSRLFFQGCLYSEQLWEIKMVSASGAEGRIARCLVE